MPLVLIGWFFAITPLKYVAHGLLPMKANTAVGFILLGLAMSCHRKDGARYALVKCGASILLMTLAALTLVECAWNCELGIDEWLVRDDTPQLSNLIRPGRMSPVAAVSFLLLIVAIATSRASSGCVRWLGQLCILAPLLVSARALIGYLYHVPVLTELGQSALEWPCIRPSRF